MANDLNTDLLPVKEERWRNGKGIYDKFDYQILGKLSRCELEDRFLRLLDEQTHIKKLANSQEEKIKKLGTKLLRLLNEKKIGRKFVGQIKTSEDLELRIIELEHENYALKDKNTVLKQQLSSHARHPPQHRSPLRSNYTSPLMTTRHSVQQSQSENGYDLGNKNASETHLQEAESHIGELNEEIKSLHGKIEFLQRNLEKNSLDNRKVKVTENIELIRLQRSLKQQAIQIASLQAQIKCSESSQKALKDELMKAHKENDEALHIISTKQNEIMNLCSKLEGQNLNRLEESELKGRVEDLKKERDTLKERSDYFIKTMGSKPTESQKISELKKLLAEEKAKKEKLEETLEVFSKNLKNCMAEKMKTSTHGVNKNTNSSQHTSFYDKEMNSVTVQMMSGGKFLCNKCNRSGPCCKCSQDGVITAEEDTEQESSEYPSEKEDQVKFSSSSGGESEEEKVKLKRELTFLKDMLRNQTERCETQQAEIARLMSELKDNEDKCNDTLKSLDHHLKIFQSLELQEQKDPSIKASEVVRPPLEMAEPEPESQAKPRHADSIDRETQIYGTIGSFDRGTQTDKGRPKEHDFLDDTSSEMFKEPVMKRKESSEETLGSKTFPSKKHIHAEVEKIARFNERETKKRFVDQKFLESSEEDLRSQDTLKQDSFLTKINKVDEDLKPKELKPKDKGKDKGKDIKTTSSEESGQSKQSDSPKKTKSLKNANGIFNMSLETLETKRDAREESVTVSIISFKVEPGSSLMKDQDIEMLFFDFTFLDVKGEEAETPQSLPKPRTSLDLCVYNFSKIVNMTGNRKKMLASGTKVPEEALIVFKLVTDSEKFDEAIGECEDIGMAVISVKDFFQYCNTGPFQLPVINTKDKKETIGALSVNIEATPSLLSNKE